MKTCNQQRDRQPRVQVSRLDVSESVYVCVCVCIYIGIIHIYIHTYVYPARLHLRGMQVSGISSTLRKQPWVLEVCVSQQTSWLATHSGTLGAVMKIRQPRHGGNAFAIPELRCISNLRQ